MSTETSQIRKFIQKFFSSDELRDLLFDYFPNIYADSTPVMPKSQLIRMLLEHCRYYGRFADLLATLQRERPQQFAQSPLNTQSTNPQSTNPPTPTPRNPNQIFISHAHQDADVARRLATDLQAAGYATWMAPDNIRAGEKWIEAIGRGLEECGKFLLVISPHAVASTWVRDETNIAIAYKNRGEMEIFPLLFQEARLPAFWLPFQYIPLGTDYGQGVERLLNTLDPSRTLPPPVEIEKPPPTRIEMVTPPEPKSTEPDSFIHPITGKEMVKVPAGTFLYGQKKLKEVYLDTFWIDKTPVTQADYKRFIDANPNHKIPFQGGSWFNRKASYAEPYNWGKAHRTFPTSKADHPVVLVNWRDVNAYAKWAGLKLPTEEQWEKAARGTKGWKYPWGEEWRENFSNTKEMGIHSTTPVGMFSPHGDSPYGCVDIVGNVWEWTSYYYFDDDDSYHETRGGSWSGDRKKAWVAFPSYNFEYSRHTNLGFRLICTVFLHSDI